MQARHDRDRYGRQHEYDPSNTTGGEGGRVVGRHGENITVTDGDLGAAANKDINGGDPAISRTSDYVHAVMSSSSSSHQPGESQQGMSMMFSSSVNAQRDESLYRDEFTTRDDNDVKVPGGGGTYNTGVIDKTSARKRASSVDRQQPTHHPFDRVSESLLGPTGTIHPS